MKRTLVSFLLCFALASAGYAQKVAVKINALGLATFAGLGKWSPTPNLGVEVALARQWTLDVDGYWNPFKYSENKGTQFWAVQPELRYWFCRKWMGSFIGLHGQYVNYDKFGARKYVYEGHFAGAGLSYGYALPLSTHWRLEGNLGLGWNHVTTDKKWIRTDPDGDPNYGPDQGHVWYMNSREVDANGQTKLLPIEKNYWGVTRAGLSLIFVIK